MTWLVWLVTLLQVTAKVVTSDDTGIPQQVSEMLREAASVTKDSDLVQRADQMCGYKYCDPQYDCEAQSSDLFCKLLCQALKNLEICEGPCSSSPCLNEGTCTNQDTGGYVCSCVERFYGDSCQFVAPPSDMLIGLHGWLNSYFSMMTLDTGETTTIVRLNSVPIYILTVDWNINTLFSVERLYRGIGEDYTANIISVLIQEDSVVEKVATLQHKGDEYVSSMALDFTEKQIYLLYHVDHQWTSYYYEIYRISYNGSDLSKVSIPEFDFGIGKYYNCIYAESDTLQMNPLTRRLYVAYEYCDSSYNPSWTLNVTAVLSECATDSDADCQIIFTLPSSTIISVHLDSIDNNFYFLGREFDSGPNLVTIDLASRKATTLYHVEIPFRYITSRINFMYMYKSGRRSSAFNGSYRYPRIYRLSKATGDFLEVDLNTTELFRSIA